ncbi:MAG: ParA family protein [Roseiarcus sp.]|uniref:AAA family ATPase n=1 Tax=Roseiarcus sp. TaxID=1969460 RepID=UPI003BB1C763
MRTIAFVTQKGGSGKSTLASSLAVAAQEMKEKVCVIDTDPQGSLTNWAKTRETSDIEVVASGAARLPALLAQLKAKGFTLAIIDTPGAEGPASAAAMVVSDLNIIPSRPSMFDLWASAKTRAALKDIGGEFVFLLNQCPPAQQTARVQDGVETLEEMGGLISPLILARVDYQEAVRHGWGVTELNPGGAAAEEMRSLWASIRRRLARVKPRSAVRKAA